MKRKTLVRILAATLSLSMAFGLSACGNQDAQQSSSNNSAPPAATGTTPVEETGATEIVMNLDGRTLQPEPFPDGRRQERKHDVQRLLRFALAC